MKILLAADGSPYTKRAVDYLASHLRQLGREPEVHLMNVQRPLPGRAVSVSSASAVRRFYRDESRKALAPAARALARRRIGHKEVHAVGDPATAIARYASQGRFDLVMMGSHGHGALSSLVLGSVVQKVLARCKVPALIVR